MPLKVPLGTPTYAERFRPGTNAGLPGHGFPCKVVSSKYKPSQFIRFETHEFSPSRFLQPVIPQRTSDRCLSHQGYN